MNVLNTSDLLSLVDATPLDLHFLALNAQEAAATTVAAGTAANTVRSYRSALAFWSAWLQWRYGQALSNAHCILPSRCNSSSVIWPAHWPTAPVPTCCQRRSTPR
jgi:hypothetical protein